jgi:hypothetical protein
MLSKIVIISVMLVILIALGSGLVYLIKDSGKTHRTVQALTFRIGLSIVLFIGLILGFYFGWLTPH